MDTHTNKSVTQQWISSLSHTGYTHAFNPKKKERVMRLSRLWRKIFKHCHFSGNRVFEFGCGGGAHLVPLAMRGWSCVGLDVSPDVLDRAREYVSVVSTAFSQKLDISFVCADFFEYSSSDLFDLVFHVGVLEHFLHNEDRLLALQKMCALTKSGGYVVSVVPSGMHPLRKEMKDEKLGGCNIPEIDYTDEIMAEEFKISGLKDVKVLPHNLFYHLTLREGTFSFFRKIVYLIFQIIPERFFSYQFRLRNGGYLICIGRK